MNPLLLTAWLACQAFDGTTTAVGLRNPALREGNPIMAKGHIPIRISVNLGALLFYRKNHKSLPASKALPIALAASGCANGAWNLRQLKKVN